VSPSSIEEDNGDFAAHHYPQSHLRSDRRQTISSLL